MYCPPSATETYFNDMLRNIEAACDVCSDFVLLGDLKHDYKIDETLSTNPVHCMEQLFCVSSLSLNPLGKQAKVEALLMLLYPLYQIFIESQVL